MYIDIKKLSIRLLTIMLIGLFMIPMTSAFLETKSFDEDIGKYGEIQINEWLGVTNKADYRLMSYGTSVINVWAEGEYKLYKKTHLFTGVFYKDTLGNRGDLNDARFFIWGDIITTKPNPIYENTDCYLDFTNSTEGVEICLPVLVSNENIETITQGWIYYEKGMDLEESEGKWRLEAKRKNNKPIDFVLEAHEKEFVEWAWWNESWEYKRLISDLNGSISAINISYDSNMKSDFGDLRFLDATETIELNYTISNYSSGVWAMVRIDNLGASFLYMYYGAVGSTTTSSASDVYNTPKIMYYFDENSGVIIDAISWSNATNVGADYRADGKINTGLEFIKANGDNVTTNTATVGITGADPFTMNGWGKRGADANRNGIMSVGAWGTNQGTASLLWDDGGATLIKIVVYGGGACETEFDTGLDMSGWRMYTYVYDGSVCRVYVDGVNYYNGTQTLNIIDNPFRIGTNPANEFGDGVLDEISLYDRAITTDEIIKLYNQTQPDYTLGGEIANNILTINFGSPINYFNSTSSNVDFDCNATDETGVISLNLTINGTVYETVTGAGNTNLTLSSTETLADNSYAWWCTANDEATTRNSTIRYFTIDTTPTILITPPPTNNSNYSTDDIDIEATSDLSIWTWIINYNGTNITVNGQSGTSLLENIIIEDGTHHLLLYGNNSISGVWGLNDSIWFNVDTTAPTLTTALNLSNQVTSSLPINSTWNYTASDPHIDKCYFNTTDHSTEVITCNSSIDTAWTTGGNKTVTYCANDTFGNEGCLTNYVFIYYIQETQAESPNPIAENFDATFNLTINLTSIPTTTAILILNNTIYTPTTTTAGANGYYFEAVVQIPEGFGNTTGIIQDWFWNYTINGAIINRSTTTENITVYELGIDNCSSYGELIFNFSILDEETLVFANESLTINVEADLVLTSKSDATKDITYSNVWNANNNPQICVPSGVINNSQYWIDLTVGFSITDHVWEFYYIGNGTLNITKIYESFNGQTNQTINLMDLLTADSTSFLFNYFDVDGLAVDGSIVHVMRKYIGEGKFREVERAKQDQNGDTIVHLVEEDVIYYFMITKDGVLLHTSSEYTALCQETPCTIQIEASGGSATFPTDWDLIDGGAYTITSSTSTRNITLTYTNDESTSMGFTVYKYDSDGTYTAIDTGNDTGTSGTISLYVPQVAGNVSFFATVTQDSEFVNSEWIDFEENATDRFGVTLALFLGALIILTLGLMAVSEGVGTIVYVLLGVVISGALGLIITDLSTGVNIVVYLVLAGGILLWKLTGGRR